MRRPLQAWHRPRPYADWKLTQERSSLAHESRVECQLMTNGYVAVRDRHELIGINAAAHSLTGRAIPFRRLRPDGKANRRSAPSGTGSRSRGAAQSTGVRASYSDWGILDDAPVLASTPAFVLWSGIVSTKYASTVLVPPRGLDRPAPIAVARALLCPRIAEDERHLALSSCGIWFFC